MYPSGPCCLFVLPGCPPCPPHFSLPCPRYCHWSFLVRIGLLLRPFQKFSCLLFPLGVPCSRVNVAWKYHFFLLFPDAMVKQREQRENNRKLTSFPLRTATYPPESVPSAPLSSSTSAFQTAPCPGSPTAPTRASASSVLPASRSPTTSRSGTMAFTRASPAPRFASYARARASTKAAADAGISGTTAAQAASEFFRSTREPIPVPTHHTHTRPCL